MWRVIHSIFVACRCLLSREGPESVGGSLLGTAPSGGAQVTVVALIANEPDRELLSHLAAEHQWTVYFAHTCGEAWDVLNEHRVPIVLCDRELPGAEWRDVIHMMVASTHPVYAILVSKVADGYLWNEVIRRGGHDLLVTPL